MFYIIIFFKLTIGSLNFHKVKIKYSLHHCHCLSYGMIQNKKHVLYIAISSDKNA